MQPLYHGKIGPTFVTLWMKGDTPNAPDQRAAERALDWMFGWLVNQNKYVLINN